MREREISELFDCCQSVHGVVGAGCIPERLHSVAIDAQVVTEHSSDHDLHSASCSGCRRPAKRALLQAMLRAIQLYLRTCPDDVEMVICSAAWVASPCRNRPLEFFPENDRASVALGIWAGLLTSVRPVPYWPS